VGKLLDNGCPPEAMGESYKSRNWNYYLTPLGRAADNGRYGIVKLLLRWGTDPDSRRWENDVGNSPLMQAISKGHLEID